MNTRRAIVLAGSLCLLLAFAVASARELTVKDVIDFKKMNFSDEEIIAEIVKTDSKFTLTDQDVTSLRAAKASDQLIRAMRNPPRKITLQDVASMVKANKSDQDILDAIAASPQRLKATLTDVRDLKENKAPMSVIVAVKGTPLGVADLQLLAENRVKPEAYDTLAQILGFQNQPLALADAKSLLDAGVPAAIVAKLKEAGEARPKVATGDAKPQEEKTPDKPVKNRDGADEFHPAEFVGNWTGVAISDVGGDSEASVVLRADGTYALRIGLAGQAGKWHVAKDASTITMTPSPGMPETHTYEMNESNTKLTINGATGKLVLNKRAR